MPDAKHAIKAVSQFFGYQIRKCPRASSVEASFLHIDPFFDEQFILKDLPVNIIFDIGAHVGQTAKHYRQLFKTAKIFSFEPSPESYSQLIETSRSLSPMETYNLAVAETSEEQTFYLTSSSPQSSLLKLTDSSVKYYDEAMPTAFDSISVKATSLDEFCKSKNIDKIQICKMDIQGAELLALKGATELLGNKAVDLFHLEVCFNGYYQHQALFYQICDFLARYDYRLFGLYNLYHGKNNLALVEGDAVFISPSLADNL